MPIYEYTFGVHVEAENESDAWEKVRLVSQELDKIDLEGDSSVEGPAEVDWLYKEPKKPEPAT